MVQLSFTLPVPADGRAREVGLQFLRNNGFREPQIVHATAADRDMTFYVAYAKAAPGVDPTPGDGDRGRGAAARLPRDQRA